MSLVPDNCNLQKRRADRKQTDRSLEKFATNSAQSTLQTNSNCRNRINSVFRLKLRDLHEIRNKKKMSQSMIRSKKSGTTSDTKILNTLCDKDNSSVLNCNQRSFKQNTYSDNEISKEIKGEYKNCRVKSSKSNKADEVCFSSNIVKNSIQGIITPVVQISYNQIKNVSESNKINGNLICNPISSQRSNRVDLLQTANNLNKTLSRKAKSDARIGSTERASNKISFALIKERRNEAALNFNGGLPTNASTSFQHHLNLDEEDYEIDEHYPGEDLLKDENNSINKSAQYCKRSMSEMQKSIINLNSQASKGKMISLSKATYIVSNKLIDKKNKSNFNTKSNGIKTVSLNELSLSVKSCGLNSARQLGHHNCNDLTISANQTLIPNNTEKSNMIHISESQIKMKPNFCIDLENQKPKLLSCVGNNNSISSLKINDKNMLIDLCNQMNSTYYSPLARERSNTVNSNNEMALNKCKSSNSMSSSRQINSSQIKQSDANITNTPYSNIKISNRYKVEVPKKNRETLDSIQSVEDKCETFESSLVIASKNQTNSRVPNSIKNNLDVQKVREAILGSIDSSNSDYRSFERRKMRFLNSLDESKDCDLFRQKFGQVAYKNINIHTEECQESQASKDLLEKCKNVQKMLEDTKMESRKKSTGKDQGQIVRYSNLNKRFANKSDSVQKVEVFLSSHENNDFINQDNSMEISCCGLNRKNSNTETLKPLIIKPKEHSSLFKNKLDIPKLSRQTKLDIDNSKNFGALIKQK